MSQVSLTIDDKKIEVEKGTTILEAAKKVGVEVPHYCYHPGLSIDGNCRMCLIEVEGAPKPMIACNTQVAPDMVVKTQSSKVTQMRQSVMEFMLINHPLDCPTCDQAGECRLQDYYMKYDEIPSRFREEKVHKDKMVDLGANVMLDQERCIACTRCIRFCQEVAKKDELALTNRGDHVTITTFPGEELSNPYAGNVVDICPVGALTSKEFRFQKRVWFLERTPSICTGCSRGCNIEVHHHEGKIYRLLPRHNPQVNDYWMCDAGRHGYHFVNDNRLLRPTFNQESQSKQLSQDEALSELAQTLKDYSADEILYVAHANQTLEDMQAFEQFAKAQNGKAQVYFSQNKPKEAYSDDILITEDKNANTKGAESLGFVPLNNLKDTKKFKAAIVCFDLNESEQKLLAESNIKLLVAFATNHNAVTQKAKIALPVYSFAESHGHFINCDQIKQKIQPALKPKGEMQKLTTYLDGLTDKLNQTEPTDASAA